MIADRISDARAGLIARGRRIAGMTPFGHSANGITKQLVPLPAESSIVNEIFTLVASGTVPTQIARIAAEKGWRTRAGRLWSARQVLDTVSNPVYLGRFRTANGTREGIHEPIVSREIFK